MIDHDLQQLVIDQRNRNLVLHTIVKSLVNTRFRIVFGKRVKRGVVHNLIADFMGVKVSNSLCCVIKECLSSEGVQESIIRGDLYYKNLDWKEQGM